MRQETRALARVSEDRFKEATRHGYDIVTNQRFAGENARKVHPNRGSTHTVRTISLRLVVSASLTSVCGCRKRGIACRESRGVPPACHLACAFCYVPGFVGRDVVSQWLTFWLDTGNERPRRTALCVRLVAAPNPTRPTSKSSVTRRGRRRYPMALAVFALADYGPWVAVVCVPVASRGHRVMTLEEVEVAPRVRPHPRRAQAGLLYHASR